MTSDPDPRMVQALRLVQEFERQVINLNKKMASEADFDDDHEAFNAARKDLIAALSTPAPQPSAAEILAHLSESEVRRAAQNVLGRAIAAGHIGQAGELPLMTDFGLSLRALWQAVTTVPDQPQPGPLRAKAEALRDELERDARTGEETSEHDRDLSPWQFAQGLREAAHRLTALLAEAEAPGGEGQ